MTTTMFGRGSAAADARGAAKAVRDPAISARTTADRRARGRIEPGFYGSRHGRRTPAGSRIRLPVAAGRGGVRSAMEPALRPMTATSAGDVTLAVLGFGVLALFVLLILWAILVKLRLPPAVKLTARLRARETRRHEQAARALGLEYTEDDPGLLDVPLSLMSWGTKRWIHHVSYGTYRGRDVHLFRLYFQVPGGRYGPTLSSRRGALAWIDAAFPHIVIEHRGVFEAAEGIHGAELLHFDPEFDEAFRVRSTDPVLAAEILDANVRRWLLTT